MICPFQGMMSDRSCDQEDCALWVNSMGYVGCAFLIQALKGLKQEDP